MSLIFTSNDWEFMNYYTLNIITALFYLGGPTKTHSSRTNKEMIFIQS